MIPGGISEGFSLCSTIVCLGCLWGLIMRFVGRRRRDCQKQRALPLNRFPFLKKGGNMIGNPLGLIKADSWFTFI